MLDKYEKAKEEHGFYTLIEIEQGHTYNYIKDYDDKSVVYTKDVTEAMRFYSVHTANYHKCQLPSTLQHFHHLVIPTDKLLESKQITNYLYLSGMDEIAYNFLDLDSQTVDLATKFNVNRNWINWCKNHNNFGLASSLVVAELLADAGHTDFIIPEKLIKTINANIERYIYIEVL